MGPHHIAANAYRRRGQAPALHRRSESTCCVVFGTYRRRDTQVPPYELCRQSVGECRAAPVCAAVRCGGDDDRRIPANPYPMYQPPGEAEGPLALSPQQCEAWIENLTAPIQSHRTKPLKKLKIPNFKSFTRFFSCEGCPPPVCLWCSPTGGGQPKSRGPGGSAPGRWPQPAKHPPVATGEIPAGRSQRNSRAAHGANSPR